MNPLTKVTPETTETMLNVSPPLHLKHRAVFMVPYEPFDGPYAGRTDVMYLSVGLAQWRNSEDPDAVSAKTWRYVDGKWSRLSEELPLHRLVDLCVFAARSVFGTSDHSTVVLPAHSFEGQRTALEARQLESYPAAFAEQRERLKTRLRVLRDTLNALKL